jgi:RHS repeat-associated protein
MLTAVSGRYTNTVAYAYDPVGRKGSESLTIASQTYTVGSEFNARNELTKYTYPDGSIANRAYTARGALSELKLDSSVIDTRTYDDGGRLTSEVLGNGITETRAYRTDNLLSSINYSNTNVGNLAYSWDANKNKTAETIAGVMSGYGFTAAGTTYDFEDRLTGYQRASGSFNQSWSLTTVGDWTSVTTNGTAQTRTHGPTHELLTAGGQTVTTDVKGNQTRLPYNLATEGKDLAMQWDFDNRMIGGSYTFKIDDELDIDGRYDVAFKYDALGRRVSRALLFYENKKEKGEGYQLVSSNETVFFQADQQTIADYVSGSAASSPIYRYVYGSYIDEPVVRKTTGTGGTVLYYHRNQQYSVTALSDSSGNVSERYAYTAYGQPTFLNASGTVQTSSVANNRYTYTGREWDSTLGLHHFRARWMSGLSGRFLTRDPIGYVGSEWNLYESFDSKTLNSVDPDGKLTIEPLFSSLWSPFHVCAKDSVQKWRFRLSKKAKNICASGSGGWIVQKVVAKCSGETCPKDRPCNPAANAGTAEFWEAWYVGPNEDTNSGLFQLPHTDISIFPSPGKSCGSRRADGEVRFYCSETTDEQLIDLIGPKHNVNIPFCGGSITSADLPSWDSAPYPWNTKASDDGVANRWHKRDWDCCPECAPPIDSADANPKK